MAFSLPNDPDPSPSPSPSPSPASAPAPRLYWTELGSGTLRSAELDGSDPLTLASDLGSPQGLAIDPCAGLIYWADPSTHTIERANLDGSARTTVATVPGFPVGLDVDAVAQTVYWCDPLLGVIGRVNLELGTTEQVLGGLASPQDVRVDHDADRIYWLIPTAGIYASDLAGDDVTLLTPGFTGQALSFTLAPERGRLFWISFQRIRSVGLLGDCEDAAPTLVGAGDGIVFNPDEDALYWIEPTPGRLVRAAPDGSGEQQLAAGLAQPRRLAIGPAGAPPSVIAQSGSLVADAGDPVTLSVEARGTGPLAYQWRRDAQPLADSQSLLGTAAPVLQIAGASRDHIGVYECVVSGPFGDAVTDHIVVGVRADPADANFDGILNDQDFFEFVNNFFDAVGN